jgi:hypothetical protein
MTDNSRTSRPVDSLSGPMSGADCEAKAREMMTYAAQAAAGLQRSEWEHMAQIWRELAVQPTAQAVFAV